MTSPTNLTSSIQVSEEMIRHGAMAAEVQGWEDITDEDVVAIYLAMRSKDHSIAVDDVREALKPFTVIAKHCAFEPDETILYVHQGVMGDYPLTIGDFRKLSTLSTGGKK